MTAATEESIAARVVGVLPEHELVLDAGTEVGVERNFVGTLFTVHAIHDLESEELLGEVKRPELRFRVVEVQPRLSVAEVLDSVSRGPAGSIYDMLGTSELVRVTGDQAATDWRTKYVLLGAPAEILRTTGFG